MRTLLAKTLLIIAAVTTTAAQANPRHVRLWRGYKSVEMSENSFIDALNRKLFPATGELMLNDAGLDVYVPATLNHGARLAGLPDEVALLSYQDEETYKAYRSTPAGKHYGELHWDMFAKERSKSLVAEEYSGTLAVEHAYVYGNLGLVGDAASVFVVQYKNVMESEDQWLGHLNDFLTRNIHGNGFAVLVAKHYAFFYLFGRKAGGESDEPTLQESLIKADAEVSGVGDSIYYTLNISSDDSRIRDVWNHHFKAWGEHDLVGISSDYGDKSILVINDEIYRGQKRIQEGFAHLFMRFDQAKSSQVDRVIIEGNLVYLLWSATTKDGRTFLGTDSFTVRNGVITSQTVTSDPELWRTLDK